MYCFNYELNLIRSFSFQTSFASAIDSDSKSENITTDIGDAFPTTVRPKGSSASLLGITDRAKINTTLPSSAVTPNSTVLRLENQRHLIGKLPLLNHLRRVRFRLQDDDKLSTASSEVSLIGKNKLPNSKRAFPSASNVKAPNKKISNLTPPFNQLLNELIAKTNTQSRGASRPKTLNSAVNDQRLHRKQRLNVLPPAMRHYLTQPVSNLSRDKYYKIKYERQIKEYQNFFSNNFSTFSLNSPNLESIVIYTNNPNLRVDEKVPPSTENYNAPTTPSDENYEANTIHTTIAPTTGVTTTRTIDSYGATNLPTTEGPHTTLIPTTEAYGTTTLPTQPVSSNPPPYDSLNSSYTSVPDMFAESDLPLYPPLQQQPGITNSYTGNIVLNRPLRSRLPEFPLRNSSFESDSVSSVVPQPEDLNTSVENENFQTISTNEDTFSSYSSEFSPAMSHKPDRISTDEFVAQLSNPKFLSELVKNITAQRLNSENLKPDIPEPAQYSTSFDAYDAQTTYRLPVTSQYTPDNTRDTTFNKANENSFSLTPGTLVFSDTSGTTKSNNELILHNDELYKVIKASNLYPLDVFPPNGSPITGTKQYIPQPEPASTFKFNNKYQASGFQIQERPPSFNEHTFGRPSTSSKRRRPTAFIRFPSESENTSDNHPGKDIYSKSRKEFTHATTKNTNTLGESSEYSSVVVPYIAESPDEKGTNQNTVLHYVPINSNTAMIFHDSNEQSNDGKSYPFSSYSYNPLITNDPYRFQPSEWPYKIQTVKHPESRIAQKVSAMLRNISSSEGASRSKQSNGSEIHLFQMKKVYSKGETSPSYSKDPHQTLLRSWLLEDLSRKYYRNIKKDSK